MSLADLLGYHVISNDWMNFDSDPNTHALGHAGLGTADIFNMAANVGGQTARVGLSLRDVTIAPDGTVSLPLWQISDIILPILQNANANPNAPIQVIFEFGDVPTGMSPNDFAPQAHIIKTFVSEIYRQAGSLADNIAGWEIGNEPNEINIGLYQQRPWDFASYVSTVADSLADLETEIGRPIPVIAGAFAYDNNLYMQGFFNTLGFNPNVDGFAIHPYTFAPNQNQVDGTVDSPDVRSKRPTDWTIDDAPLDDNDFQGAIYNLQGLMNAHGYDDATLSITEVGVPSWIGFRNPGPDGRDDQGRWIAEAVGVLESWDNDALNFAAIHSVVDFQTRSYTDNFNLFDQNPDNNNDGTDGEGSFGLFERIVPNAPVTAKPGAYVISAYQEAPWRDPSVYTEDLDAVLARLRVTVGEDYGESIALDAAPAGSGFTNGSIVLAKGGDDSVTGSAFDDSIFAGNGNDVIDGKEGADRLYGGEGNDVLIGGSGDDDIYGNTGDDWMRGGYGFNQVDGGVGWDTLQVVGSQYDYQFEGDGQRFFLTGYGETSRAYNVEQISFAGDGSLLQLANANINSGNGLSGTQTNTSSETLAYDAPGPQFLNGTATTDVFVIDALSSNFRAGPTQDGTGIVVWNGGDFDVLIDFEKLRFQDRDVVADAEGRFIIQDYDINNYEQSGGGENTVYNTPETQHLSGTSASDVFVYSESSEGYQAGPTEDGTASVIWKGPQFDILDDFDILRFTNGEVYADANGQFNIPVSGANDTVTYDDPTQNQTVWGTAEGHDTFVIDDVSFNYGYNPTADGLGVVVWQPDRFDILYDFDALQFNDTAIAI